MIDSVCTTKNPGKNPAMKVVQSVVKWKKMLSIITSITFVFNEKLNANIIT